LRICEPAADDLRVSESRTSAIVAGAAAVVGSLWAPWYAIDFGPEARSAIGQQTNQLPGVLGDFARKMLTLLPTHIEATAWQVFDKADIILFACAIVAVVAALIDRMDVVAIAGGAAACTVVLQMIDRPGPSEIVSLKWGAWVALAGALAVVGASRMASKRPVTTPTPAPDWSKPTAPLAPGADPTHSFPPF
jgi:hypothetical protein